LPSHLIGDVSSTSSLDVPITWKIFSMKISFFFLALLPPSALGPSPNSTSVIASKSFSKSEETYLGLEPEDKILSKFGPETK